MPDQQLYLYEFLWRGRAPGSPDASAYHVILAQDATDAFGATSTAISQAMTPEQAKAMGFDMTKIVATIDADTMAENAALKQQLADLQARLDAASQPDAATGADRAP